MPITLNGSSLTIEKLVAIEQNRNIRSADKRRTSDVFCLLSTELSGRFYNPTFQI
jgi:hypothetical protein